MSAKDFLFELGTEELPPKALNTLSKALESEIKAGLEALLGDAINSAEFKAYGAPRRLAVMIKNLAAEIPAQENLISGPPAKIAFDAEGKPTKALEGFARKCGAQVEELTEVDGKMSFKQSVPAKPLQPALSDIITHALDKLPIPKRMRWGSSHAEFVRPVHWIVLLFGDEVVPCTVLSHDSDRLTHGHRFHYNKPIELNAPADYARVLKETGYVIADFDERKALIREQLLAEGKKIGGNVQISESLLDEVTALNEWPVALTGRFEERFLAVPPEALISTMADNQKYFHVLDDSDKLMPFFITIANIESKDPQQVIQGNERVVRPRLSDAAFFFETDKKQTLASRTEALKAIVFQKDLGTVFEKSTRVAALARQIAQKIDGNPDWAERAGLLCKADLVTDMVLEFPELQGLMGYHYANHDGEPAEVALAQNEHYMPRNQGDDLPQSKTGIAVALADRLDTLTGLFGINQPPTGSKDPFALRRAALGVLRILVDHKLDLDIRELLEFAASQYSALPAADSVVAQVTEFMLERFRAWFDEKGFAVDNYLAVHAVYPTRPYDFDQRVRAVAHFRTLPQAEALAAANKRVSNLLSKGELADEQASINPALVEAGAEAALVEALAAKEQQVAPLFAANDYQAALTQLADLREPIDSFFDDVMVMCDDLAVRQNRLAILAKLRALFLGVADISVLAS